jgi:hypothetical protein
VLTFSSAIQQLRATFETFHDRRQGKNRQYSMTDAGLSAFSAFFMQSPSFLEYQRTMQETQGKSNVQTLFGAFEIPSDNQIRHLLDAVEPASIYPMFPFLLNGLHQAGVVESYRTLHQTVLLALDGTRYFSSSTLNCPCCNTQAHANGQVTYFHSVVTPVLVMPGNDKVLPLAPAFVTPQDGQAKQDCELNAAYRWLARWGEDIAALGVTVLGDDLYCHEPFCRALLARGCEFLLVCKPDSHKELYDWVAFLERNGGVATRVNRRWTGKRYEIDTYRYVSEVPLRAGEGALTVQWCELTTTTAEGKRLYHNAFATSHPITDATVEDIVAAGRSRWKVENENNNTLKTKGYRFEHNFGHGKQHLATVLATLILLAYLLHTVLEYMDEAYCLLRRKIPSRQRLFNDMRALTTYLCFENWDILLTFMLRGWSSTPVKAPSG